MVKPTDSLSAHISPSEPQTKVVAIVLLYLIFGGGWILLSDKLVQLLFTNPEHIILVSMIKGWLFISITAALLYAAMRRPTGKVIHPPVFQHNCQFSVILTLLAAIILAVTALSVVNTFQHHKAAQIARLRAITTLKSQQISDWLSEKQRNAEFLQNNHYLAQDIQRWQQTADPDSRATLFTQLQRFQQINGYTAIMLLDAKGNKRWGSANASKAIAPPLRSAIISAINDQKTVWVGPYRGLADHIRLDIVVPLNTLPKPFLIVVLQLDPNDWLFPSLNAWPIPSVSGEIEFFRHDGDQVLFLNNLRSAPNSAGKLRLPLASSPSLAARILRQEVTPGSLLEGPDYRGIASIGLTHTIPGSDWILLFKLNQSELLEEAIGEASWIGFSGILILLIIGTMFYLYRQGQQLLFTQAVQSAQAKHLQSLQLLAAIADSSEDAIFAKDLQGRYTFYNRASCEVVQKTTEEVLGSDDNSLFPESEAKMIIALDQRVMTESCTLVQEYSLTTAKGKRQFFVTKGPLRDGEGQVIGCFGISRDTTNLKRAEQRFAKIFHNSPIAIALSNYSNGIFIDANPAFLELSGYSLDDIVGHSAKQLGLWVNPQQQDDCVSQLQVKDSIKNTDSQVRDSAGQIKETLCSLDLMELDGQPSVLWMLIDVTDQKQALEALKRSEERLHLVLEATSDGFWDCNLSEGITYLSPCYYAMTGYSPAAITPDLAFFKKTVHPDDLAQVMETLNLHLQGKTPMCHVEYRLVKQTRQILWVEEKGRVVQRDNTGAALRMVGTIADITTRKVTEDTLRQQTTTLAEQNAELERFNRAMVGRELAMIELKKQVNALSIALGQTPPYALSFLAQEAPTPETVS